MHIDKFKQYLDEGYEIIEETQVNDFKCYVFEKKFDSIVDQLKEEMLVKRIEEVNKVYQDAFTTQNLHGYKVTPASEKYLKGIKVSPYIYNEICHYKPTQLTTNMSDEELGRSNACKIKLSEMMGKLIKDRIENGR